MPFEYDDNKLPENVKHLKNALELLGVSDEDWDSAKNFEIKKQLIKKPLREALLKFHPDKIETYVSNHIEEAKRELFRSQASTHYGLLNEIFIQENESIWAIDIALEKCKTRKKESKRKDFAYFGLKSLSNLFNYDSYEGHRKLPTRTIPSNTQALLDCFSKDDLTDDERAQQIEALLLSCSLSDINEYQVVEKAMTYISPRTNFFSPLFDFEERSDFQYYTNALVMAIEKGFLSMTKILLDNGAKLPEPYQNLGISPLRLAVAMDETEIVDYLLSIPENVPVLTDYLLDFGRPPEDNLVRKNTYYMDSAPDGSARYTYKKATGEIVTKTLDEKFHLELNSHKKFKWLLKIQKNGDIPDPEIPFSMEYWNFGNFGEYLLTMAIRHKNIEMLKILLNKANMDASDIDSNIARYEVKGTIIEIAFQLYIENEDDNDRDAYLDCINLLLMEGAQLSKECYAYASKITNKNHMTYKILAAAHRQDAIEMFSVIYNALPSSNTGFSHFFRSSPRIPSSELIKQLIDDLMPNASDVQAPTVSLRVQQAITLTKEFLVTPNFTIENIAVYVFVERELASYAPSKGWAEDLVKKFSNLSFHKNGIKLPYYSPQLNMLQHAPSGSRAERVLYDLSELKKMWDGRKRLTLFNSESYNSFFSERLRLTDEQQETLLLEDSLKPMAFG